MKEQLIIFAHIVFASVLAGAIGFEREAGDKPAGIRTNMIIGGAVTLLVILGEKIVGYFIQNGYSEFIDTDPTRVIQAIIVGISFIGAGMVLQIENEYKIKYLTSAATILFSTGVGISVALRQYLLAIATTLFIIFINYVLASLSKRINRKNQSTKE